MTRNLNLFEPVRELEREPTTDDFTTPLYIVDRLDVYGRVGLDPATNATSHVKAIRRIMLPDDGLAHDWRGYGLVWCNPPYSDPLPWVKKAAREADQAIFLVPTQTAPEWGRRLLDAGNALCFVNHRIRFELDGVVQKGAMFSCMLVGIRVDLERFRYAFDLLGKVVAL